LLSGRNLKTFGEKKIGNPDLVVPYLKVKADDQMGYNIIECIDKKKSDRTR